MLVVGPRHTGGGATLPIKTVNGAFVALPLPKGATSAAALSSGPTKAVVGLANAQQTPRVLSGGTRMSTAGAP